MTVQELINSEEPLESEAKNEAADNAKGVKTMKEDLKVKNAAKRKVVEFVGKANDMKRAIDLALKYAELCHN